MTTSVNVGRQTVLTAIREFSYDDFTSGTAASVIYLKPGTQILRGFVDITTAFNSTSSDSIDVGDTEGTTPDTDRYTDSVIDAQATGVTALSARTTGTTGVPGQVIETAEAVTILWTSGGGTPTAGAGRLVIEYVEDERTTELHPYRG